MTVLPGFLLIAKKEFLDKVRNLWVVVLSVLFAAIALVLAYLSGAQEFGELGFVPFKDTIGSLSPVAQVLIPLVALILGYGTIAGEDENGSLGLLMSLTVTRNDVILGKFLGLGAVLLTTVLSGLGVAGVVIAAAAGAAQWPSYLAFMGIALLLGLAYLSLAMLLSTIARRRSTAIAGAVFLFFFFNFIYDLVIFGMLIASGWVFDITNIAAIPDWVWWAVIFDPGEAAGMGALMAFGVSQIFGISYAAPDFINPPLIVACLAIWTMVPLLLAFLLFRRRDV